MGFCSDGRTEAPGPQGGIRLILPGLVPHSPVGTSGGGLGSLPDRSRSETLSPIKRQLSYRASGITSVTAINTIATAQKHSRPRTRCGGVLCASPNRSKCPAHPQW